MSNAKKTPAKRSARREEVDGIVYEVYEDGRMVATFPGGQAATLSLILDLEGMFELMEMVGKVDALGESNDPMESLAIMRGVIPADFVTATRGIDAGLSLKAFMRYAVELGQRLGKALT